MIPSLLSSLILLGSYPMTQIYQHKEDYKRGDNTISLILGIKGTFIWTAIVFGGALLGFYFFLTQLFPFYIFILLILCLSPVLIYFFNWLYFAWKQPDKVNFEKTMLLNHYSSIGFIIFFLLLFVYRVYQGEIIFLP